MNLTKRNYFTRKANREYMSVPNSRHLKGARPLYERKKTTALLVGSYVDSYFEGTLRAFKNKTTEIFKRDDTLKAEYIQTDEIIKRIESDKLFSSYMARKKTGDHDRLHQWRSGQN